MKILQKSIAVIMLMALGIFVLAGCGSKTVPAEETAKALYDLYVLQKTDGAKSIGLTDEEIKKSLDAQKSSSINATRSNFISGGLSISNEKLEEIYAAQTEALKKLSSKIEIVSSDKDVTKVKISTSYLDFVGADTRAAEAALKETNDKKKLAEIYPNKIIEEFKKIQPSSELKEKTFDFKKENLKVSDGTKQAWIPSDITGFATELGKMIMK